MSDSEQINLSKYERTLFINWGVYSLDSRFDTDSLRAFLEAQLKSEQDARLPSNNIKDYENTTK